MHCMQTQAGIRKTRADAWSACKGAHAGEEVRRITSTMLFAKPLGLMVVSAAISKQPEVKQIV